MSIEALKKLVAAVDAIPEDVEGWMPDALTGALIDAKKAIAEAEKQEPHSWYSAQEDEWMTNKIRKEHERLNSYTHKVGKFDLALYTHPQPKREWVGLTMEEVQEVLNDPRYQMKPLIAHAVETKLKEKNT